MLGLGEQVERHRHGVGRIIQDHRQLARSREAVDANFAEELALRLGDPGVAGARDHVHGVDRVGSERQGRHPVRAAKRVDLIGTRNRSGGEGHRAHAAVRLRRRREREPLHPGGPRRHAAHQDRGRVGRPSTRRVHAGRGDRPFLDLHPLALRQIDLDRGSVELGVGDRADVARRQFQRGDQLGMHVLSGSDEALARDPVRLGPLDDPVEVDDELVQRGVPALADRGDDLADPLREPWRWRRGGADAVHDLGRVDPVPVHPRDPHGDTCLARRANMVSRQKSLIQSP